MADYEPTAPNPEADDLKFRVEVINPQQMFQFCDEIVKQSGFHSNHAPLSNTPFQGLEYTGETTHLSASSELPGSPFKAGYELSSRIFLGPGKHNQNHGYYSVEQVWEILAQMKEFHHAAQVTAYTKDVYTIQIPKGDLMFQIGLGYPSRDAHRQSIITQAQTEMADDKKGWGLKGLRSIEEGLFHNHVWLKMGSIHHPANYLVPLGDEYQFSQQTQQYAKFYEASMKALATADKVPAPNATIRLALPNR